MTSTCESEQGMYVHTYVDFVKNIRVEFPVAWDASVKFEKKATEYPWVYWGRQLISPHAEEIVVIYIMYTFA